MDDTERFGPFEAKAPEDYLHSGCHVYCNACMMFVPKEDIVIKHAGKGSGVPHFAERTYFFDVYGERMKKMWGLSGTETNAMHIDSNYNVFPTIMCMWKEKGKSGSEALRKWQADMRQPVAIFRLCAQCYDNLVDEEFGASKVTEEEQEEMEKSLLPKDLLNEDNK